MYTPCFTSPNGLRLALLRKTRERKGKGERKRKALLDCMPSPSTLTPYAHHAVLSTLGDRRAHPQRY